jgi:hypothetical protein
MSADRRTILSLIATGRITPRQAERLLAVWSDRDETIVRLALVLAIAWLLLPHADQIFAGLAHAFNVLLPRLFGIGRHAFTLAIDLFGGVL